MKLSNLALLRSAGTLQLGRIYRLTGAMACVASLAVFSFAVPASAQKHSNGGGGSGGGGSQGNLAVTSTLNDSPSYQLQSDGLNNGVYQDVSVDSAENVSSILQEGQKCGSFCGDWVLGTKSSPTRSISITLVPDPNGLSFPGAPPPPAFSQADVAGRIIVQCSQKVSGSFLAIKPGANLPCLMSTNFDYAGSTYRLSMNSDTGTAVPETNDALVACTGGDANGVCNAWTVTPTGTLNGNANNVARLEIEKKGGTWAGIGDYDFNFAFKVTIP